MKRRRFIQSAGGAVAALSSSPLGFAAPNGKAWNILWITCEDMSPFLGCFGDEQARTPNLDRLATEGVCFDRAFSVSGVCAPSRSCLITGMYPTSLGTMHMRCRNQPPESVHCFPAYLRNNGYYCTNNQKEDYNFVAPAGSWDESSNKAHFRNRTSPEQPFFAVFNFTITHESKIGTLPKDLGPKERELVDGVEPHDPAGLTLPPYYPDTPLIREHWAHTYNLISAMDKQAGEILAQLEADGLADSTIVFFFSDHGIGAPRGKRWMYDTGLHVPLIVRWPGSLEAGTRSGRLVSFVDFAPTVLSLANIAAPSHMQGRPFLGSFEETPRKYISAARDRMDERYELIRAVRDDRYKYIRNYEPHVPYDDRLTYPESWPIMQELRRVKAEGGLPPAGELMFRQVKPLEELYDTESDPFELNNLAEDPAHAETLARLRKPLENWLMHAKDLGFVPEFELAEWLPKGAAPPPLGPNEPYSVPEGMNSELAVFGTPLSSCIEILNGSDRLSRYRAAKSLAAYGQAVEPVLHALLSDQDPCVVFWAARAFGNMEQVSEGSWEALTAAIARPETGARLGAAYAFVRHNKADLVLDAVLESMNDENAFARLRAAQLLELVGAQNPKVETAFKVALEDKNEYVTRVAKRSLGIPGR